MTADPNKLVGEWLYAGDSRKRTANAESLSGAERRGRGSALLECAGALSAALAWRPMTYEPKGEEGALLAIDSPDSGLGFACWDTEQGGWDHDLMVYSGLSWADIRERFPDAVWCYLPRRKNDD